MAHSWNKDRAIKRIETRLNEVETITIKEYVRETDLHSLPKGTAYRVDGVHVYVDMLNMRELLATTAIEGETCHKRGLRFLNNHYRGVHRIISELAAIEVDFHNQRLHSVIAKPYDDEAARIYRAIAMAQLIIDVLAKTGETAEDIPAAQVRVGIDSGTALAVRNGRRGHSEPLFLGVPANHAAKRAGGGSKTGIYVTNNVRTTVGWATVTVEDAVALTDQQIQDCQERANLSVTTDQIVKAWEQDLANNPIGKFTFSGHTPPYANLDLETLSPANSRRQDALSVYADIDGFTAYVASHIDDDEKAKHVVKSLHVLRSEMDAVLSQDFGGVKVRFIGDCIHGGLVQGTAQTTDNAETVSTGILCAGALRSSFDLALERLDKSGVDVDGVGLAIGFDFGPLSLTRLGVKGSMIRCALGRCVLSSEDEQRRCAGDETAIGDIALGNATDAGKAIFNSKRKRMDLTYEIAVDELAAKNDNTAKASIALEKAIAAGASTSLLESAAAAPAESDYRFRTHNATPTKSAGFA